MEAKVEGNHSCGESGAAPKCLGKKNTSDFLHG